MNSLELEDNERFGDFAGSSISGHRAGGCRKRSSSSGSTSGASGGASGSCYIGLSLPLRLAQFRDAGTESGCWLVDTVDLPMVNEEVQFEHDAAHCLLCSRPQSASASPHVENNGIKSINFNSIQSF